MYLLFISLSLQDHLVIQVKEGCLESKDLQDLQAPQAMAALVTRVPLDRLVHQGREGPSVCQDLQEVLQGLQVGH